MRMKNLLEKDVRCEGASLGRGMSITEFVISLIVVAFVIYLVGIPVIKTAISNAALTGTDKTIADVVPTLLGLMMFLLCARGLSGQVGG
ncbi:MAG: hypothetical protein WC488_02940 [Candidatus Micrarchaeia archaeon]